MTVATTDLPPTWPPYAADFVVPAWADQALKDVVEHYIKVGVPLPARQYWTLGQTAHDCEQCVLAIQQMFLGTSEAPLDTSKCDGPRGLTFTLEVLRCVPTLTNRGQAPVGDAIEVASVNPVIDMEIMLDLTPYFDPYNIGVVVNVDPLNAEGGYHGAICTYTVSL